MGNEQSKSKELTKNGKLLENHENGGVNGLTVNVTFNGLEVGVTSETEVQQNGKPSSLSPNTEPDEAFVIVESDSQVPSADAQVIPESPDSTTQTEEVKKTKEEKVKLFGKMFKKKTESSQMESPPTSVHENESSIEDQMDVSPPAIAPQPETADIKEDSESFKEPESVTPDEGETHETDTENNQLVESQEDNYTEENPVMNFFKTLVTPTKTSKKETATPDATKDQSQKEAQPTSTTTTTVAQVVDPPAAAKGMSIPPPPPPEPAKMEIKGEPAVKPVKPTPKEEPKAAAKQPEASKGKSAKDALRKFFQPKTTQEAAQPVVEVQEAVNEEPEPVVEVQTSNNFALQDAMEELPQPVVEVQTEEEAPEPVVEVQVDVSKASTLEAAAKPEPPPPVQEEKKAPSKTSFLSLFKPKAGQPKKETSAPPAAADAVQTVKAKEEPKAAPKSPEGPVDNKSVSEASQGGDDEANVPRKLEKRNSIHLFFKNLVQKRPSIDAGVQTEPVTVAPAAEKAK